jgi:predicted permease
MNRLPAVATLLLELVIRDRVVREGLMGDLEERLARPTDRAPWRQRAWLWGEIMGAVVRYSIQRRGRTAPAARQRMAMDSWVQDIRFGFRTLLRRPFFAAMAILTLALGIGVSTGLFSVVDWVLLRSLPYRSPGEIVTVWQVVPWWKEIANLRDSWDKGWMSHAQFEVLRENTTRFSGVAIHDASGVVLTGEGRPRQLTVGRGSASLLSVLGISPALGRWFSDAEEGIEPHSADLVVVVSHDFWINALGGEDDVIGRTLTLSGEAHTVIGVLPPRFRVRELTTGRSGVDVGRRDLWIPASRDGGYHWEVLGRLAPGASIQQAAAEVRALLLPQRHPDQAEFRLLSRRKAENQGLAGPLGLLLCATGVLLLIACGNVANLLLGEVHNRRAEIATRVALGAGKRRIVRQLLTESLVLGGLGSALGIALARAATPAIVRLGPSLPWMDQIGVDLRVVGVAVGVGMLSALGFGALPAWLALRGSGSIRGQMGARWGAGGSLLSSIVVGAEVALTCILVSSAALLAGSLIRMAQVDPGFDPNGLAAVSIQPPDPQGPLGPEGTRAFTREVLDALGGLDGVVETTYSMAVPFDHGPGSWVPRPGGAVAAEGVGALAAGASALGWRVAPNFPAVMGMNLLAGRFLSEADLDEGSRSTLVSESLADLLWPGQDPLGASFAFSDVQGMTVVGIVGDIKHTGLDRLAEPSFYMAEGTDIAPSDFIVRTSVDVDPALLLNEMKATVWEVDPDILIRRAGTVESYIDSSGLDDRYRAFFAIAIACAAAVLATIGVFGVTARAVIQRKREFGVRMALGASEHQLIGGVVRGSMTPGALGALLGLVAAFWAGRLLEGFLFGIEPDDPAFLVAVTAEILLICVFASYYPARQIAELDPAEVLREE